MSLYLFSPFSNLSSMLPQKNKLFKSYAEKPPIILCCLQKKSPNSLSSFEETYTYLHYRLSKFISQPFLQRSYSKSANWSLSNVLHALLAGASEQSFSLLQYPFPSELETQILLML